MKAIRIPLFLAPAFAESALTARTLTCSFSSTTSNEARWRTKRKGNRDSNKQRGVSAMRSTGTRQQLASETLYPELPRPRKYSERISDLATFETNKNHGLYGFFNEDRQVVLPGEDEDQHGRAWTSHDLTFKSFEDLHALHWQCVLELNRIATRAQEFKRLKLGYGAQENQIRMGTVKRTMANIKKVLARRQLAYEEAKLLAEKRTWTAIGDEIDRRTKEQLRRERADPDLEDLSPGPVASQSSDVPPPRPISD